MASTRRCFSVATAKKTTPRLGQGYEAVPLGANLEVVGAGAPPRRSVNLCRLSVHLFKATSGTARVAEAAHYRSSASLLTTAAPMPAGLARHVKTLAPPLTYSGHSRFTRRECLPRREIVPGRARTRQELLRRRAPPDLRLLTEPARKSRTIGSYQAQGRD